MVKVRPRSGEEANRDVVFEERGEKGGFKLGCYGELGGGGGVDWGWRVVVVALFITECEGARGCVCRKRNRSDLSKRRVRRRTPG